jgi:SLT domain-containing protein
MGMAKGGIVSGLVRGYAKGAITKGPELAMIGEGTKREAIVPLPDNRSIPVTFLNKDDEDNIDSNDNRPINITINGVEGTEKGLKRSAAQIAYEVHRTSRNKVMRY